MSGPFLVPLLLLPSDGDLFFMHQHKLFSNPLPLLHCLLGLDGALIKTVEANSEFQLKWAWIENVSNIEHVMRRNLQAIEMT